MTEKLTSKYKFYDKTINLYQKCNLITVNPALIDTGPIRGELIPQNIDLILKNMIKVQFFHFLQLKNNISIFKTVAEELF